MRTKPEKRFLGLQRNAHQLSYEDPYIGTHIKTHTLGAGQITAARTQRPRVRIHNCKGNIFISFVYYFGGRQLKFFSKLLIIKRRLIWKCLKLDKWNMAYFNALLFLLTFCTFSPERWKMHIFIQKWLHHLLLVTSYLLTIATNSH